MLPLRSLLVEGIPLVHSVKRPSVSWCATCAGFPFIFHLQKTPQLPKAFRIISFWGFIECSFSRFSAAILPASSQIILKPLDILEIRIGKQGSLHFPHICSLPESSQFCQQPVSRCNSGGGRNLLMFVS